MKLILQTANLVGDEKNCLYPNRAEVTSAEELQEAVKMDHVCAEYDNDYRNKENFRQSNVLVMDCDNDHTENPAEWITPEKLDEMMPDISYAGITCWRRMARHPGPSSMCTLRSSPRRTRITTRRSRKPSTGNTPSSMTTPWMPPGLSSARMWVTPSGMKAG